MAGKALGSQVLIKVAATDPGATSLGGQTDGTLTRTAGTADVTDKDSSNWREKLVAVREWSVTASCIFDQSDTGYGILRDSWENQTALYVLMLDSESSETYGGLGILTDLTLNGPLEDATNYSVTIEGTAALTTG